MIFLFYNTLKISVFFKDSENIISSSLYKINRRKGHIPAAYADNTFLPFALLAAKTFLPPAVLILALNPCTFDLDLFFG